MLRDFGGVKVRAQGNGRIRCLVFVASARLIERRILFVRDEKVPLVSDIADLYEVPTKRLNEAVSRNLDRFPLDFMFQLAREEMESLRSQIATSKAGRGGRRYLPRVFTEQGVAMLSSVLNSERAVQVNIELMRAFVRLRQLLITHADLAATLKALEKKYDKQFAVVFKAIRQLMTPPPEPPRKRIEFHGLSFFGPNEKGERDDPRGAQS